MYSIAYSFQYVKNQCFTEEIEKYDISRECFYAVGKELGISVYSLEPR